MLLWEIMGEGYVCPRNSAITGDAIDEFFRYAAASDGQRQKYDENEEVQRLSGFRPSMTPEIASHVSNCKSCHEHSQKTVAIYSAIYHAVGRRGFEKGSPLRQRVLEFISSQRGS